MASLRFILGRAGAGKTHTCISEIAAKVEQSSLGSPLIFLVPDQASFQAERALTHRLKSRGYSRARVLSFNRLAAAILGEVGGLAQPELSTLGRQMLLRGLLLEKREHLKLFAQAARQPGFVMKLEATLQELSRYNHSPSSAISTAGKLPGTVLQHKLNDLGALWEAFQHALAGHKADSDAYVKNAVAHGHLSTLVTSAEVWVDGFASFTPLERDLLIMLIRNAQAVHLALCMEPAAWSEISGMTSTKYMADPVGLFHRTQATCAEILLAARAGEAQINEPLLLCDAPRFQAPDLLHLEKQFGAVVQQPYVAQPGAIRLVEAVNRRAEVEAVGRAILHLCREKGYRYRDIAIITRDLTPYHDLLTAIFSEMGIPCFIDRRTSVAHHPVVELLRSSLEVVASGWELRPLLRCLKTDLLPISRAEVDALENYALEHGLRGSAWRSESPWLYGVRSGDRTAAASKNEQISRIDAARRRIAAMFAPLQDVFGARQVKTQTGCEAIFGFLQQAGVPERLQEWAVIAADAGALQESHTHQQVWDACIDVLEQMVAALGDSTLTSTEFAQVLEAGLENLHLGLIPPSLDQVLIGAVDRSRQPHLRAAFVLGVGERSFPAVSNEDSMFTDTERELLQANGFALGPSGTDQALQEQYLGYIAFTRAAELLWVSYPLAADDGRALAPSPFINLLRNAFPHLKAESVGNTPEGSVEAVLPWLISPLRLAAAAVSRVRAGEEKSNWLAAAGVFRDDVAVQRVMSSLGHSHHERPLPSAVAAKLAGASQANAPQTNAPLRSSVSRLESFAACPFQHYTQHLLRLRERQEFLVQFTDIGLLVHETLHRFVQELKKSQLNWASLSESDANQLADKLVDQVAPRLRSEVFMSSARYHYLVDRMKRVLHTAIWVWTKHAQGGKYRPVATELPFGEQADVAGVPGLRMELPGGGSLELHGRIDRVDAGRGDRGVYLRVVDYKGSGAGFSVIDVHHGLRLQLVVYLAVAMQAAKSGRLTGLTAPADQSPSKHIPGGAYYFGVKEPLIDATRPLDKEALEKEVLKHMQVKGITLGTTDAINVAEEGGRGQLIPAKLTKAGEPYSNPLTVSSEQFEQLFSTAANQMTEFATRILAGEVNAAPFRYPNGDNACRFCRYHVVCHFDPQVPGDRYRRLAYRENRRSWEMFDKEIAHAAMD